MYNKTAMWPFHGLVVEIYETNTLYDKFVLIFTKIKSSNKSRLKELNNISKYDIKDSELIDYNFQENNGFGNEENIGLKFDLIKKLHIDKNLNLAIIKLNALNVLFEENPFLYGKTFRKCFQQFIGSYTINGYELSLFCNLLTSSRQFRNFVILYNLKHNSINCIFNKEVVHFLMIRINLKTPKQEIIDYAWNSKMQYLVLERRELDNAMAWLSTLGGACSALGDSRKDFALVAGKISARQFKIAVQLGDPMIVLRCKLYFSLSLIQRGFLTKAKKIIREQYYIAKTSVVVDTRAISMCCGIWSKLQYECKKNIKYKNTLKHK